MVSRLPDRMIEVRLESQAYERVAFAYTEGTGEFSFRGVSVRPSQTYYIVIELEGFKPVRERLDDGLGLGSRVTIFLGIQKNLTTQASGHRPLGCGSEATAGQNPGQSRR